MFPVDEASFKPYFITSQQIKGLKRIGRHPIVLIDRAASRSLAQRYVFTHMGQ
jgi:hypothetical protein